MKKKELKDHIKSDKPFDDGELCKSCEYGVDIYVDPEKLSLDLLNKYRSTCSVCKQDSDGKGPYKYDLANRANRAEKIIAGLPKPEKGVKRGSAIAKRFGPAIEGLTAEGKSQRAIAKILDISTTSVNDYLNGRLKVIDKEKKEK